MLLYIIIWPGHPIQQVTHQNSVLYRKGLKSSNILTLLSGEPAACNTTRIDCFLSNVSMEHVGRKHPIKKNCSKISFFTFSSRSLEISLCNSLLACIHYRNVSAKMIRRRGLALHAQLASSSWYELVFPSSLESLHTAISVTGNFISTWLPLANASLVTAG